MAHHDVRQNDMNPLLESIAKGWSWKLGCPVDLLETNHFGNAIVTNSEGSYYRIMPEEWSCELIATSFEEFTELRKSVEFVHDWEMRHLVTIAESALGPLTESQVYCLVKPGILGGTYTEDNIRKISLRETLDYSGYMAEQIKDVPDGENVEIVIENED